MSRLPRSRKPVLQLDKIVTDISGESNSNSSSENNFKDNTSIKDDPFSKEMETFMAVSLTDTQKTIREVAIQLERLL